VGGDIEDAAQLAKVAQIIQNHGGLRGHGQRRPG
jgi:hypothetical protein